MAMMMIPGVGTALGLGMIAKGISVAAVVGLGMMVAGNVLMGPTAPKMPVSLSDGGRDRLHANLDPTAPRKFVLGHTAMATDVRYQAFTGTNQEYLEQIICVASHEVQSIDEIWLDNEKAWTAAGGAQGRYVGYLTVVARTVGTSANGIAIDGNWTTSSTLTGCAYVHLKAKLTGNTETAQSPFSSGVTSRMTIRGKGAKVYDPRLDSTVAGGAGTHRANDQATWAWNDNASRNPALQALWFELGWKINGKIAVGKGVPSARLDLASYAVAANACDESVTKADLTTEPRYRSDGVLSEGDDPSAIRETLAATMNAVVRDAGGKLSLTVLANDLATPDASFNENDVIGGIEWQQTPSLHSSFNIVGGRRIDPSDAALYQPVDFPDASLASPDGIDRIESVDYPLVQSSSQAQRLAKQRLQRNQYQGQLQLTGKPSWWQLSLGDVFQFTHPTYGWTNKLFRCAGIQISRTGETQIVAVEENAAIYAWDKEEQAAVVAGTPTVYDPLNSPLIRGIDVAGDTAFIIDPQPETVIFANSDGTIKSGELPRQVGIKASVGTSEVTTSSTWSLGTLPSGITCTIGATTGILTITAFSALEALVPITAVYNGVTRSYDHKVRRQDDPPSSGGGGSTTGGTSASTSTLGNATSTAYGTGESAILKVAAGSNGQVACTAPVYFKRLSSTSAGFTGAFGKWQWRALGGTFADVAVEVADNYDSETYNAGDALDPIWVTTSGYISVSQTKTGLTNGTEYEFKFVWRKADTSGAVASIGRTSGTLEAKGS